MCGSDVTYEDYASHTLLRKTARNLKYSTIHEGESFKNVAILKKNYTNTVPAKLT